MKSMRLVALLVGIGVTAVYPSRVLAQQEIAPDHFDESTYSSSAHSAAPKSLHRHNQNVKVASRHSGSKAHHHHSHVSA